MTSGGVATAAVGGSGNEPPLHPLGGKDMERKKERYKFAVSNHSNLEDYRRGTDVLAILLKSDPSFYVIGRFCKNKK